MVYKALLLVVLVFSAIRSSCLRPSRRYVTRRTTGSAVEGSSQPNSEGSGSAELQNSTPDPDVCEMRLASAFETLQDLTTNCVEVLSLSDCCQLKFLGVQQEESGVYRIANKLSYCDMTTDKGGWLVIQRRMGGMRSFRKNWRQYARGFGVLDRDFWMGLDRMHELTSTMPTELRVDLQYPNGTKLFAHYDTFQVAGADDNYRLTVRGYRPESNASDALAYHDGMAFTTTDRDNDNAPGNYNCAVISGGEAGWWYNWCWRAHLNSLYVDPHYPDEEGVYWLQYGREQRFTFAEMKIRPKVWHCGNVQRRSLESAFLLPVLTKMLARVQ